MSSTASEDTWLHFEVTWNDGRTWIPTVVHPRSVVADQLRKFAVWVDPSSGAQYRHRREQQP